MDTTQRQHVATLIREELNKNKDMIHHLEDATRPIAPDNAIGRLSRMDAIGTKSINERALAEARYRQAMLQHALRTIDNPEFALCTECGSPIPIGRILIMPEATMCVSCAQEAEQEKH